MIRWGGCWRTGYLFLSTIELEKTAAAVFEATKLALLDRRPQPPVRAGLEL